MALNHPSLNILDTLARPHDDVAATLSGRCHGHRGLAASLGLGKYEAAFRENEIDETVLPSLTEEHLKQHGVTALGHRLKLLDAIAALRDDTVKTPSADATAPPSARSVSRAETVSQVDGVHFRVFINLALPLLSDLTGEEIQRTTTRRHLVTPSVLDIDRFVRAQSKCAPGTVVQPISRDLAVIVDTIGLH